MLQGQEAGAGSGTVIFQRPSSFHCPLRDAGCRAWRSPGVGGVEGSDSPFSLSTATVVLLDPWGAVGFLTTTLKL